MSKLTFLLLAAAALLFAGCERKISGDYVGACENHTVGVSAEMVLRLNERNGIVSGRMLIGSPLEGDGPISGVRRGNMVEFTSGDSSGSKLTWTGTITKDGFFGEYFYEPSAASVLFLGNVRQSGRWIATRR